MPARDEAERLPHLLRALAAQSWIESSGRVLTVVILLNNCLDASSNVVRQLSRELPQLRVIQLDLDLPLTHAHVGFARRQAMNRAAFVGGPLSVLLSTDADAIPAEDWVDANMRAIDAGADLVGGLLIGDPAETALLGSGFASRAGKDSHYKRLLDHLTARLHPVDYDPWPRHVDHTGASLAVRTSVYWKVGGIPPEPVCEDISFVFEAVRAGFRLRHAPDVQVRVSTRLDGRATGGMATCLQRWVKAEALGLPQLVDHPAACLGRLARRAGDIVFRNDLLGPPGKPIPIDTAIAGLEHVLAAFGDR